MPGLSCSMRDLQSFLWHVRSLVMVCGIQFPDHLGPLHWEHGVLATGPGSLSAVMNVMPQG